MRIVRTKTPLLDDSDLQCHNFYIILVWQNTVANSLNTLPSNTLPSNNPDTP